MQPKRFIGLSDILKRCSLANEIRDDRRFPVHAIDYSALAKLHENLGGGEGGGEEHFSRNLHNLACSANRRMPLVRLEFAKNQK